MPDLICLDGDLNGYGCISSQFVQSLTYKSTAGTGDSQWFGKITRFRYELQLPAGVRITDEQIMLAIEADEIVSTTVTNITYTADPADPNVAYAEGEVEIVAKPGSPIPSSPAGQPYKFKHTIHHVWRLTETRLTN